MLTIIAVAEGFAQSSKQDPTTVELEKQMDEMRSQMAKMQDRIAELEAARGKAAQNSSPDPVVLQSQTLPAHPFGRKA